MAVRESGTNAQISSEGSNNGFEKFCAGESDINNASTPIPGPEDPVDFRAACADNGVEYVELPIALDAIVLIANEQNEAVRDIMMAELRRIWEPGSSVDTWSDLREGWPHEPMDLFGRNQGSGRFLDFTQKVNGEPGAIREDYEHSADLAQVAHWAAEAPYSLAFMGVDNYLAAPEGVATGSPRCLWTAWHRTGSPWSPGATRSAVNSTSTFRAPRSRRTPRWRTTSVTCWITAPRSCRGRSSTRCPTMPTRRPGRGWTSACTAPVVRAGPLAQYSGRNSSQRSRRVMAISADVVGRTYPSIPPYLVGREKIREFASAVHATDAAHHDVAAARAAGYADLVAPPTFAIIVSQRADAALVNDPEAGIDFSRVVHADQRFTHHRPVVAGDELTAAVTVDNVRPLGSGAMVTSRVEITTVSGEKVATTVSSLLVRGEDQ